MVPENMKKPYEFELFHESSREPFDLYAWGNDFFRPLVELDKSRLAGVDNLEKIAEYLKNGENVFLMSNHQVTTSRERFQCFGVGGVAGGGWRWRW